MKRNLLYLLILATATAAAAQGKPKPKPSTDPQTVIAAYASAVEAEGHKKPYSCVAGPGEECASDLWYADYMKWHATQLKYSVPKDVQDLQNGRAQRLNSEIPPGYEWSDAKQRFVKKAPPVPAQPLVPAEKK